MGDIGLSIQRCLPFLDTLYIHYKNNCNARLSDSQEIILFKVLSL